MDILHVIHGAIYTTVWARPVLCSAQAEYGLLHLHLLKPIRDILYVTHGAIYTIAWAEPTISWVQAEHGLLHLHLLSGPDLNQKFCVIIALSMSSV